MSLGLIARADDGGLGVQTWEIARHMHPERILIATPHGTRGEFRGDRYEAFPEVRHAHHPPTDADFAWLLECTSILTVEGCYNDALLALAHQAKRRLIVYANPELFPKHYRELGDRKLIEVWGPTTWRLDHLGPHATHMTMPVATDRLRGWVRNREARTFLHISAPAMLDRNGTELVRAALGFYDGPPITLRIAGPGRPPERTQIGAVSVEPVADVGDYWERWNDEGMDWLVQPRRYGGLSLVYQEAAAAGIPSITLDRHPEDSWGGTLRVPVSEWHLGRMKGGRFRVEQCDPRELAAAMVTAAATPNGMWSASAARWAHHRSWVACQLDWNKALR